MIKSKTKKNRTNKYKKSRRPKGKINVLDCVKNLACFLGGVIFVSFSSMIFLGIYAVIISYSGFSTTMVVIGGAEKLTDEEIMNTAGIQAGDNLFKINLGVTRKKLMAHPWVKDVEIERELPSRLNINITEQNAAFALDAGGCFLVNYDGEVFNQCTFRNVSIPVVRGLTAETMSIAGTGKKKRGTLTKKVLELIDLSSRTNGPVVFRRIKEINADEKLGLNLFTDGSISQIRLGLGNYKTKFERITEISELIKKKAGITHIDMIDLFDINRIVVKPAHT